MTNHIRRLALSWLEERRQRRIAIDRYLAIFHSSRIRGGGIQATATKPVEAWASARREEERMLASWSMS
jgi:hypothetical protein